jgi:hypothetical protein
VIGVLRVSIVLLAMATPAVQARPLRPSDLGQICAAEIANFCPALSPTTAPRDLHICLKPYHYSLSLPCRRALKVIP